ncbi:hypothetical protein CEP54_010074 [Fusarium duplospermum]|uniref:F-box domain-containing protein n=1 Tax=Fusarium duplospermum TaxID=1325734 RepID=A0A428PM05_9HYPO|nr:hypothetical protein CEP54_010074 [Fusarium duplospermum]
MTSIKLSIRSSHDTQPGTATPIMPTAHSPLLAAPMELHQQILASLPDAPSLAAAALSCQQLYAAFKNKESTLARAVLSNCIGAANLPEALMVHRCSPPYLSNHVELQPRPLNSRMENQVAYVSRYIKRLNRSSFENTSISMSDALALSDFHLKTVSILAQRFIVICTERHDWQDPLRESIEKRPVSPLEWNRIERVLYRFELFRKLFGRFLEGGQELLPLTKSFLKNFAPWENAQLGFYNYVAAHDIVWGAYNIGLNGYGGGAHQHLLTLGLTSILEIARSETFEERSRLVGGGIPIQRMNNTFLKCALDHIWDIHDGNKKLAKAMRKIPPFFCDGDDGAEDTWRYTLEERVYDFYTDPLFEWGCVMWDSARFDFLEIYEERERNPAAVFDERDVGYDSFGTRFDLYELGHRGYWAPDNRPSS